MRQHSALGRTGAKPAAQGERGNDGLAESTVDAEERSSGGSARRPSKEIRLPRGRHSPILLELLVGVGRPSRTLCAEPCNGALPDCNRTSSLISQAGRDSISSTSGHGGVELATERVAVEQSRPALKSILSSLCGGQMSLWFQLTTTILQGPGVGVSEDPMLPHGSGFGPLKPRRLPPPQVELLNPGNNERVACGSSWDASSVRLERCMNPKA